MEQLPQQINMFLSFFSLFFFSKHESKHFWERRHLPLSEAVVINTNKQSQALLVWKEWVYRQDVWSLRKNFLALCGAPAVAKWGRGEVIPLAGRLNGFFPAVNVGCPWSGECCSANPPEGTEMKRGEKYSGGEEKGRGLPLLYWSEITREQPSRALLPFSASLGI